MVRAAALAAVGLMTSPVAVRADDQPSGSASEAPARWTEQAVARFEALPIQHGGRVKPLETFAQFQLLKLRGTRSMPVDGGKLSSMEWLLDALFHPEEAKRYPTFVVDNAEVVTALGIEKHDKRRDRYSYVELFPEERGESRRKLSELWNEVLEFERANKREDMAEAPLSRFQRQVKLLGEQVNEFEFLVNFLDVARARYPLGGDADLAARLGGSELRSSDLLDKLPVLREIGASGSIPESLQQSLVDFEFHARTANSLILFPPPDEASEAWLSPGQMILGSIEDEGLRMWSVDRLRMLERLVDAVGDPPAFDAVASELHDLTVAEATARGEYGDVELEARFYQAKPVYRALYLFVAGFLVIALSWLAPASRFGRAASWGTLGLTVLGLFVLVYAITLRSLIRGLAPITNLYETILFITAFMVLLCLVVEGVFRNRIGIALAPVLGFVGLFLSIRYEAADASDTINSLPAVLITNFWLSTHVPCINIGYAGCMLAAKMSWIYIGGRLLDPKRRHDQFFRDLSRMVYGVLCFGMIFALVGTVLGGIWANDSWGRFWGWDPKENGALMIVLWSLAMLHARLGGFIREFGLHLWSVILGMIVVFSWFHVNVLGVGLHSYGFTSGIKMAVFIYYGISLAVLVLGMITWWWSRSRGGAAISTAGARERTRSTGSAASSRRPSPVGAEG